MSHYLTSQEPCFIQTSANSLSAFRRKEGRCFIIHIKAHFPLSTGPVKTSHKYRGSQVKWSNCCKLYIQRSQADTAGVVVTQATHHISRCEGWRGRRGQRANIHRASLIRIFWDHIVGQWMFSESRDKKSKRQWWENGFVQASALDEEGKQSEEVIIFLLSQWKEKGKSMLQKRWKKNPIQMLLKLPTRLLCVLN